MIVIKVISNIKVAVLIGIMSVSRNMELRHLQISQTTQLSHILDQNDSWKSLMEKIPQNLADLQNEPNPVRISRKYSAENIR